MSKTLSSFLGVMLLASSVFAAGPRNKYTVNFDLNKVDNDKLTVEIIVPQVNTPTVRYNMPKIVPGTYSISDFGRFVSNFQAFDSLGNNLATSIITENIWEIQQAEKLYRIKYSVEDTYDTKLDNKIFEPAGTNIEQDKNFVLNNFGFFGYLDKFKDTPYTINVTRPDNFYGATSLKHIGTTGNKDVFEAKNYFEAHDCPIMYCLPDTAMIKVGNADVLIAVYSPNKQMNANEVRGMVESTLDAQRKYLGGTLPTDIYSILIYLSPGVTGSFGALEHQTSTMFYLPEQSAAELEQTIKDVTAHEFFHIVTPLTIHSQHIHDYDFINPQMSQHLWMYEGVTEYSAQHVQVKYGLFDETEFFNQMRQKMLIADNYNDTLPFTTMSLGALDKYANQYANVYQKGALIGMCIDVLLRDLSDGKYGIQNLMKDLSAKYGVNNFFDDNALFGEIEALTYPEVGEFLRIYVSGNKPLPFKEILARVGVDYTKSKTVEELVMFNGRPSIGLDQGTGKLFIISTLNLSSFGKKLGIVDGDIIDKVNGEDVSLQNTAPLQNFSSIPAGTKVTFTVLRKDKKGNLKSKTLKGKAVLQAAQQKHFIEPMANPTERQLKIKKAWLEVE